MTRRDVDDISTLMTWNNKVILQLFVDTWVQNACLCNPPISAGIPFFEVDLSAHIVFLEMLPKAKQNGVVQASVLNVLVVKRGFSFQISCRSCFSFSHARILHAFY